MKIGVFGDSYSDIQLDKVCWPTLVGEKLGVEINYHAMSGTSLWWSFQEFKKHYKKYDVILFSFTTGRRWPHLPKNLTGRHFNIGFKKEDSILDKLNPYFPEIFSNELLGYLSTSIHKDVVEMCESEGKYLVQIVPFLSHQGKHFMKPNYHGLNVFFPSPNRFPMIFGLDDISHMEKILYNGKEINTCHFLSSNNLIDYRGCHLNEHNNKVIANWVVSCIQEKIFNLQFSCGENLDSWSFLDINYEIKI
jgi:hypothetical protein